MYQMVIGKCLMVFGIIMLIKGNESFVIRKDIFLTTKVWVIEFGYEKTRASVEESLRKLKTD